LKYCGNYLNWLRFSNSIKNSFLPWILAALQVPKKNGFRGNYSRKYGICLFSSRSGQKFNVRCILLCSNIKCASFNHFSKANNWCLFPEGYKQLKSFFFHCLHIKMEYKLQYKCVKFTNCQMKWCQTSLLS